MRISAVTFQTAMFNTATEAAYFINPGNFGEDAISWLKQALQTTTSFNVGDVIQEDYGWGVWVQPDRTQYWVALALTDESRESRLDPPEWRILVAYDPGCLWIHRLSHPYREEDMKRLRDTIDRLLRAEPRITSIGWEASPKRSAETLGSC